MDKGGTEHRFRETSKRSDENGPNAYSDSSAYSDPDA